jgi:hypothetical protein
MKKWITTLILLIALPLAYAASYGEGPYGCGLYGVGCESETETVTSSTGGGASSALITTTTPPNQTLEEVTLDIQQELLSLQCRDDQPFVERIFSKCKIPDNGICDDGENYILNRECVVNLDIVRTGELFKVMWFIRFILILSIFLLVRDSKQYPLAVIAIIILLVYNEAFIPEGMDYDRLACTDVNLLINFGYCVMPDKPMMGWLIGLAIIALLFTYFVGQTKKKKKEKKKPRVLQTPPKSKTI